jgi:hypothetical protein
MLLSSEKSYERTSRETISKKALIGYKDCDDIVIVKNRLQDKTGKVSVNYWNDLVKDTMKVYGETIDSVDCDLEKYMLLNSLDKHDLILKILKLNNEVNRLKKQNTDMGWILNPDRMGGQFSEWETSRRGDEWS